MAEQRGIRVLGVVDHSTARNAQAVEEAAPAFGVRVLVGLEVESAEGVHILTLFDSAEAALEMDAMVAQHLPSLPNRPQFFGEQHLLDAWGNRLGEEPRLLTAATDLGLEDIADLAVGGGGLSIPAHIDRRGYGLLPTLGFVPPGLRVDLLEVSPHMTRSEARETWPELRTRALISGSDAHFLTDIGCASTWVSRDVAEAELSPTAWGRELAGELLSRGE